MSYLQRHKTFVVFGVLVIAFYFLTRLSELTSLPIFTDEAIYIRWAQIAKNDPAWRFISLTDGKQPLFIWFTMVFLRFFEDPLLAGRLVSTASGLATLVGLFFLGREVFRNRWVGIASAFLYALYPFALVYDRMALYDTLVGTLAVWSLYLTVLLARTRKLDVSLLLGMVMGGSVLNKSSGFFNVYLLPLSLLLFDWQKKERGVRFMKWIGLAAISAMLAYGFYSILRLSPFFHIIEEKNALFVYPLSEWVSHPFTFFWGNLWIGQRDWLLRYMQIPVLVLVVASFFIRREFLREKVLLVLWFAVPFAALALFGKTLYPRFVFFMTLSLLPLCACSFVAISQSLRKRELFAFVAAVLLVPWLRTDYLILSNFASSPLPRSDREQYKTDWPSGEGVREAVDFFKKEAKNDKIYVGTQGTFGLMPYALEIYLSGNLNITIEGFWPVEVEPPQKLLHVAKKMPTYFVFYQDCQTCAVRGDAPITWPVRRVLWVQKKVPKSGLGVYRVVLPK